MHHQGRTAGLHRVFGKATGRLCSQSEQCAAGLACFKLNDEPDSICRAFCIEDADCGDERKCDLNVNFGDGQLTFCGEVTVGCNAFNNPIADCAADCTGKECGTDGCGGSCGSCGEGTTCSADNLCVAECVPSTAPACGDDGCGGSCGECTWEGEVCFEGACCEPSCEGKACGDDGCGGSCGECGEGEVCGEAEPAKKSACQHAKDSRAETTDAAAPAVSARKEKRVRKEIAVRVFPPCEGLSCGDNGCGGSCGECPDEESCQEGVCAVCTPNCDGKVCGDDGCGGSCGSCEEGLNCIEGVVCSNACVPDCEGKSCGDDGCGGTCGSCDEEGAVCEEAPASLDALLTALEKCAGTTGAAGPAAPARRDSPALEGVVCSNACVPECDGKTCGDDGCGGSCGDCAEGEMCSGTFSCIRPVCRIATERAAAETVAEGRAVRARTEQSAQAGPV